MFSVVITEKGGAQRRLDFDKNEVTIGRVQGNDIILPKGNVSKRHSRIVLKDNRFIVVDLKSTNGTYVNGRKITSPLVVKSGDKIYIGDFIMTLEEAAGVQPSPASHGDFGAPAPQMAPQQSMPQQGMAPQQAAPPPQHAPPPQQYAPPPQHAPPPQQHYAPPPQQQLAPPQMPPPMAQQGPPPMGSPSVPVGGDRRPPPLRSAPPPPRQPTLSAGGMGAGGMGAGGMGAGANLGAPPPLPSRESAPRVPSEAPPAPRTAEAPPGERYHLDEEPADETMAPSARIVAAARPASRQDVPRSDGSRSDGARSDGSRPDAPRQDYAAPPRAPEPAGNAGATEAPPPRMHHAPPPAAEPVRPTTQRPQRRDHAPRARDPRDPLGHVLATLAESIDLGSLVPPEAIGADQWRDARSAADAAIQRLESEGGTPGDRDALASAAVQEALGLGPLAALLDDVGVLELVVEGPTTILVDRGAGLTASPGRFSSADQLVTIIGRLISRAGGSFDGATAMHEATLPDGAHLLAVLPPVAVRGPVLEIRRTGRVPVTGENLVQQGMITADMLATLRAAISARRNVVVVGAGDVGVTAFVSMLANLGDGDDRVLAIEPAPELALSATHVVRLSASSTVSLGQLLTHGPRLRADRIVVDGVSGAETRGALLLLASRGGGCVLGVRSAPTAAALDHIQALAGLEGASDSIGTLLAAAVHVVVRLGRDADGVRRALSVAEVTSEAGVPTAQELWSHTGEFTSTGHTASFQR